MSSDAAGSQLSPKARKASGRIEAWDDEKGYGFVRIWGDRIFLHIRDFAEHHKRPEVGDRVTFFLGVDKQGRRCATGARHMNDGGRITKDHLALVGVLLVLPVLSLVRCPFDWRWITGYFAVINILTYSAYYFDKRSARQGGWRIPEKRMHLLEILGGWPVAFIAQRQFRHKTSKAGYQSSFWLIVAAYQWVAFDAIFDWRYSRMIWGQLKENLSILFG